MPLHQMPLLMGWCLALGWAGVWSSAGAVPSEELGNDAWAQLAGMQFNEAEQRFAGQPYSPARDVGWAVALLGVQPHTQSNVRRAEALLEGVAAQDLDPGRARQARYYLARIVHVHREPTAWDEAASLYRSVYDENPLDLWGQRSLVRWGMITLLRQEPGPALDAAARVFAAMSGALTDAEARRDAASVLFAVYTRLNDNQAKALEAVLRVLEKPDLLLPLNRANLHLAAAELARDLGKPDIAIDHYQAFLALGRADRRSHLVSERLAELQGHGP